MAEFLSMGGYAKYVWPSYIIVIVLFGYQYFAPLLVRRKLIRELHIEASEQISVQQSKENNVS